MTKKSNKTPYGDRTDLQKIESQWVKLSGLHKRKDWSASIVRAATMAELATNIAIRHELMEVRKLEGPFVDSLLRWANGLTGKIDRLLVPVTKEDRKKSANANLLKKLSKEINDFRNEVVHQGAFASEEKSEEVKNLAIKFVNAVLATYNLKIDKFPKSAK